MGGHFLAFRAVFLHNGQMRAAQRIRLGSRPHLPTQGTGQIDPPAQPTFPKGKGADA